MTRFAALRKHYRSFVAKRSPRERYLLLAALAFLLLASLWALAWQPAALARTRLLHQNARLEREVLKTQSMAREAADIRNRAQPPLPPEQIKARVESTLARKGLTARTLDLDMAARQLRLSMEIPFEQSLALMDDLRRESRWMLLQARFEATPRAGMVRTHLTWTQP